MRILILALYGVICSLASAQSFNERTFSYKGTDYITKIPNDLPETWVPGSPIPLSTEKAFELANDKFLSSFNKLGKFNLNTIALNLQSEPNGWLYMIVYVQDSSEVSFAETGNGVKQGQQLSIVYFVTMDGTVFGPNTK